MLPIAQLVAQLDGLPPTAYSGPSHRHVAPGRPALSGDGARLFGGRWNPPDSYATLYLGLDRQTVVDEFHRLARRQGLLPADFLPRDSYLYQVELVELVDLRDEAARSALGLDDHELSSDDLRACQAVGEAAHHAGREGILAPSAAGKGSVLAVFLDRLRPGSVVCDVAVEVWEAPTTE